MSYSQLLIYETPHISVEMEGKWNLKKKKKTTVEKLTSLLLEYSTIESSSVILYLPNGFLCC